MIVIIQITFGWYTDNCAFVQCPTVILDCICIVSFLKRQEYIVKTNIYNMVTFHVNQTFWSLHFTFVHLFLSFLFFMFNLLAMTFWKTKHLQPLQRAVKMSIGRLWDSWNFSAVRFSHPINTTLRKDYHILGFHVIINQTFKKFF